ncbi:BBE domain-containing protein [Nonomuraea sp. NPDC049655]|uniref:BBE domain-containing protein n=1 Tax=Nonomuraea sp. NPDC049655 TaxID=3364355 RepID=UPI00379E8C44
MVGQAGEQVDQALAHPRSALLREEADHRRLSALKARYDPDRLFRVNHNIAPAAP